MAMDQTIVEKIEAFFTAYKQQTYKKGELLIRADDSPSGVFYLKEGHVKEYAISKKGDELVINVFRPIAFFPMSWVINDTPNKYFFEAITDVVIWKAPKEDVKKFIKSNPDVLYDLLKRVFKGTDGILVRMMYLMGGNAFARLITELLIQANRFGKEQDEVVTITISEKDLAALTGMTRETVSREIKILKDKGYIRFEKNQLIILQKDRLEKELVDGV